MLYNRFKGDLKGAGAAVGAGALSYAKGDEEEGAKRLMHATKTAGGAYLAATPEGRAVLAKAALPLATKLAGAIPGAVRSLVPAVQRAFAPEESAAVQQQVAAKSTPSEKLQNLARTSLKTLGAYGSILSGALQRGGQKEYDGRVFVLGQTDPGFQQLQQDLAKESQ